MRPGEVRKLEKEVMLLRKAVKTAASDDTALADCRELCSKLTAENKALVKENQSLAKELSTAQKQLKKANDELVDSQTTLTELLGEA